MSNRSPASSVWPPVHSSDFQAGYNGTPRCCLVLHWLTRKTTHGDDDDGRTTSVARLAAFRPDVFDVYGCSPLFLSGVRFDTPRTPPSDEWKTTGHQEFVAATSLDLETLSTA